MSNEKPMFPPSAFRVVGGTDFSPATETQVPIARGRRKHRSANKDHTADRHQNGFLLIDPEGETDKIFFKIAKHRAAAAHYDRCVDIEGEAEGKVSTDEFFHLQCNTSHAFNVMIMWARAVISGRPTTRRGLIHQARYLASLITEPGACDSGGPHLPDKMNSHPWWLVFLNQLATGLRKMGGEFGPEDEGARQ